MKLTCPAKLGYSVDSVCLIDTGSMASILAEPVFRNLPHKFRRLYPTNATVRTASGDKLNVLGVAKIPIRLGKTTLSHHFIVVKSMNTHLIVGLDLLRGNKANLNCGTDTLTIGQEEIPLTSLECRLGKARLTNSIHIESNSIMVLKLQPHKRFILPPGHKPRVETSSSGFIKNEPGLYLMDSVAEQHQDGSIPAILVNETGRSFKINKGANIGNVTTVPIDSLKNQPFDVLATNVDEPPNSNLTDDKPDDHKTTPESPDTYVDPKYDVTNYKFENDEIPSTTCDRLNNLIQSHADVFARHAFDVGNSDFEASINLKQTSVIRKPQYKIPIKLQDDVKKQIADQVRFGILEKTNSSWRFPLVCVGKKDGRTRVCLDLRSLNDVTEFHSFPLTDLDSTLAELSSAKYFSVLDLNNAYAQIKIKPSDKHIISFETNEGVYSYNRLCYGWLNSPGWFCMFMADVLRDLPGTTSYMDDILIYSDDLDTHLERLEALFKRLKAFDMRVAINKCNFFKDSLVYLGYLISRDGLRPDPSKVEVIKNLKPPSSIKQVRQILGFFGFYRRLIPEFSKLARPLTELTGKNAVFQWTEARQKSFDDLRDVLLSDVVLAYPDVSREFHFELHSDASNFCIGGVLSQYDSNNQLRPVYFLSKQLSGSQKKWSVIEKELYSVIFCLERLRPLIYGCQITVRSDHNPLKYIESSKLKKPRLTRWSLRLQDHNAKITYIKGKSNVTADYLSRLNNQDCNLINTDIAQENATSDSDVDDPDDDDSQTSTHETPDIDTQTPFLDNLRRDPDFDIRLLQQKDKRLSKIITDLHDNPDKPSVRQYTLIDDCLFFLDDETRVRLVLPESILPQVIKETHTGFMGAHLGIRKNYATLQRLYHCKGMYAQTVKFIESCEKCASTNTRSQQPPLGEIPIPNYPFEVLAIDFCGPFPESQDGCKYVITASCMLTGYVIAKPTIKSDAITAAKFLVEDVITQMSCPSILLSDNGSHFDCEILHYLTTTFNINHIKITPYRPEANPRCERSHRGLVDSLIKLASDDTLTWSEYVRHYVAAYNCADNNTGYSPFMLVFHRLPRYPLDTLLTHRLRYYGDEFGPKLVEKFHKIFRDVRSKLKAEALANKKRADVKSKPVDINVGDRVYLQNMKREHKLSPRWLPTPHIVIKRLGHSAFLVQDPISYKTKRRSSQNLRRAKWNQEFLQRIPKPDTTRPHRGARHVVSSSDTGSSSSSSDTDDTYTDIDIGDDHDSTISGPDDVTNQSSPSTPAPTTAARDNVPPATVVQHPHDDIQDVTTSTPDNIHVSPDFPARNTRSAASKRKRDLSTSDTAEKRLRAQAIKLLSSLSTSQVESLLCLINNDYPSKTSK